MAKDGDAGGGDPSLLGAGKESLSCVSICSSYSDLEQQLNDSDFRLGW